MNVKFWYDFDTTIEFFSIYSSKSGFLCSVEGIMRASKVVEGLYNGTISEKYLKECQQRDGEYVY